MKKIILVLIILTTLSIIGCDNSTANSGSYPLDGTWTITAQSGSITSGTISLRFREKIIDEGLTIEGYFGTCNIDGEELIAFGMYAVNSPDPENVIFSCEDSDENTIDFFGALSGNTVAGQYYGFGEYEEGGTKAIEDGNFIATKL